MPEPASPEPLVQAFIDRCDAPPDVGEVIASVTAAAGPAALDGPGLAALVRADARACGERFELVPTVARYAPYLQPGRDRAAVQEVAHQVMVAARADRDFAVRALAARFPAWRPALDSAALALELLGAADPPPDLPAELGPVDHEGHPRFALGEVLSRGSFGTIVEAWDRRLDGGRGNGTAVAKFVRAAPGDPAPWDAEASRAAILDHPCGIEVRAHGALRGGLGYVVFERVVGHSLLGLAAAGRPLRPAAALPALVELCDALAELHAAGFAHGDLSPANVIVDGFGRLRMLDYGLSRPITPDLERADVVRAAELAQWLALGWVPPLGAAPGGWPIGTRAALCAAGASVRANPTSAANLAARLRRAEWSADSRKAWITGTAIAVSLFVVPRLLPAVGAAIGAALAP